MEAAGGTISCRYYNQLGLRALLLPEKFTTLPRVPMPPPRIRSWYEDEANRGYLAGCTVDAKDPEVAAAVAAISADTKPNK